MDQVSLYKINNGNFYKLQCTFQNREKSLLVSSTDYGKDLFGVRKHMKNHQQLEKELEFHQQAVQVQLLIHCVLKW